MRSYDSCVDEESLRPLLKKLGEGSSFRFADWPNISVPDIAAGAYTVWDGDELVYVGMAGRTLDETVAASYRDSRKRTGLYSRLASHASGRRSGDQFCVYVADRLVLRTLSTDDIASIANGTKSFDRLVRDYIHAHLSYRFVEVADGRAARALEDAVRCGALGKKPLLNPRL
jgi:hypothetical protein